MSSTIIIRLQNLPLSAKAADIREFFSGLKIPEGQVNIVGGPEGDAFIGFASDEDARRGMNYGDRKLHGTKIKLLLSSKVEMEQVIANARAMAAAILGRNLDPFNKVIPSTKPESLKPPEVYKGDGNRIEQAQKKSEGVTNGTEKGTSNFPAATIPSDSWKVPSTTTIPAYVTSSSPEPAYAQATIKTHESSSDYHGFFNAKPTAPQSAYSQNASVEQSNYPSKFSMPSNKPYNGPAAIAPANLHAGLLPTPSLMPAKIDGGAQFPILGQPTLAPNIQAFVSPAFLPGFGPQPTSQIIPQSPNLDAPLYVQLRRLPQDLLRPAALEQFLHPNVPLTLSSVKVVFNAQGNPLHSLVRFSDINDARRVLERDGEMGIRIRQCTRKEFDEAVDGSLGVIPSVPKRDASPPRRNRRFSPNRAQPQKRRYSPLQRDDRSRRRPRTERDRDYSLSPVRKSPTNEEHREKIGSPREVERNRSRERTLTKTNGDAEKRDRDVEYKSDRRRSRSRSPVRRRRDGSAERICIELKNLPHRATAMDLEDYICGAKARHVKCTRTYYESGGNRSDRWVVEFENQKDADAVFNYNRDIHGRNVRARFISSREADDLYAIPGPDDRGGSYNQRRQNYQHQSTVSEPKPLFPEFQRRDSRDSVGDRDRGFDTRYDNRAHTQPPPLNASTEDELIVRGDLPPQSFGAFSSPSTAEYGYFKRATAEVKVAGMKKLMNGPPNLRPNAPRTQPQNSGPGQPPFQPHAPGFQESYRPQKMDYDKPAVIEEPPWFSNKQLEKPNQVNWERIQSQPFQAPSTLGQFEEPPQVFTQNFDRNHRTPTKMEAKSELTPVTPNAENEPPVGKIEENLPKLPFLEMAEATPDLKACLHLKNIQQRISSERLCIFLGVVLERPADNVFWMPDGDLYVNLSNEQLAEKAFLKNGRPLDGRLISVERVSRSNMANAVKKNIQAFIDKK